MCAKLKKSIKHKKHTYVFKAEFRSTALFIKVVARDEDEALIKAQNRREVKGCYLIKQIKKVS